MGQSGPPGDDEDASPVSGVTKNRFKARDQDFAGANDEALAIRLAFLEEEHSDLDTAIRAMERSSPHERLVIARMKKKKLILKDQIEEAKDAMLPDIIA
ncbi:MAG: DUF465 domain-containing protein [Pseudomonadota bacterium]